MENPIPRQRYGWSSVPQTTTEISVANTPRECIASHTNTIARTAACTQGFVCAVPTKRVLPTQCRILYWAWICLPYGSYCNPCCEGSRKLCLGISEKAHGKRSLLLYRNVPATQSMSSVLHLFVYRKNDALYQVTHQNKMLVLKVIKIIS